MIEPLSLKKLAKELAFFYTPWLIVGWLTELTFELLFVATALLLIWHIYNQKKYSDWLFNDKRLSPPTGSGGWESLFNGIYRIQQQQRRKRKELSKLVRRFRNGAEALPDAIVVFRREGNIVWCNKVAQTLLGFRWPDDNEQPITNLIRIPDFIKYLSKNNFDEPLEMRSPLNVEQILELRIVPYTEGEHMMLIRDVSQLKQLEGMRSNFFANVSHELRTPMTVLQGYLEMTEDPDLMVDGMWPKAHGVMTQQLNRMNGLINQLLTLSKIEAAPGQNQAEEIDIPTILDNLEKEALALSSGRHHIDFNIDKNLKVLGNEEQLISAISNLVYNAVKYAGDDTKITVIWERTFSGAKLSVTDTGEGIEAQHLHRLTERFYRIDKARSRETGGSGLGLAIVKHALTHHDSYLQIESEVGKGSQFYFVLPKRLIVQS